MSITDELREWIDSITWLDESISQAHKNVLAIADRIDKQYLKVLENATAMVDEPIELDKVKGHLNGLDKIAAEYRFNIIALDRRISAIERKLNRRND